ncbi:isocitrate lyase/PEP mutase family protein [Acidiferrobacter thiooxydans]|jgi:2-methylisocitrate lyase-like PEP mutase family enzyme|uniref:Isocitrate lyase/phosphoenolpyruvate mutase family protein n=1 Tax=Acidiferrobacter thiooxydans TaxID=163359 RepID=A0A1C2FY93_9GAMM|nr:isocitrate lyase/phosphoenolpyruvate mutase family protein [Acidiferrobacter thiooxydans]MDA8192272.1 isocitrate lyase/phosphoenolpyruvate mutase family protein [Gammaproteobacteria bacterium]RCN56214.1 isocitrate lyase/phosphoenolpyruvate mutase family protein [Acidiferrobacter thiooxydans]UEN98507.1 isocitrate lyase/phosphoenolpyruvate mutase family protein [Acidiferrobacter thiooxydans]
MHNVDRFRKFKALHVPGDPLVLYNIWDAGGAKAVAQAGASAIATSSWSIAAAHGFPDGEEMPLSFVLMIVERIAQSSNLPLTVDFEGGYAEDPLHVATNVRRVIEVGVTGINFEDQVVKGPALYTIPDQVARLKAVRKAANDTGRALFINARTDVFLKAASGVSHADLVDEALARGRAYAEAGADGFFIPGLTDATLIAEICRQSSLPVNIMMTGELNSIPALARLGVSRVSYGPMPYLVAIEDLTARFEGI